MILICADAEHCYSLIEILHFTMQATADVLIWFWPQFKINRIMKLTAIYYLNILLL